MDGIRLDKKQTLEVASSLCSSEFMEANEWEKEAYIKGARRVLEAVGFDSDWVHDDFREAANYVWSQGSGAQEYFEREVKEELAASVLNARQADVPEVAKHEKLRHADR